MRAVRIFVDTNIAFYSREDTGDVKATKAQHWLRETAAARQLCLNLQVLNELANVLFRKRKQLSNEEVFEAIDTLAVFVTQPVSFQSAHTARAIKTATDYSWWDCLLLASALELGCSHFLSEDLQDGHQIGGLTIINPFLHAPETILGPLED